MGTKILAMATHLTVIIRDDCPLIHCGDVPKYRRVTFELTDDQKSKLQARSNGNILEEISKCFLENVNDRT